MGEEKLLSPKLLRMSSLELAFYCPGCKMLHPLAVEGRNRVGAIWTWDNEVLKPTFNPSVDVKLGPGRRCHSFVIEGKIRFLTDCTHAYQGQIVDLPDIPEEEL